VDSGWHLVLIDFSRCFTPGTKMVHTLTRVDEPLWNRMKQLTEASLTTALGKRVGKSEIQSIIKRRDAMQQLIDKLVQERGEKSVFMRDVK
jgi:enoyl reductase-like protein